MTDITARLQNLIGVTPPAGSKLEFFRSEMSGVRNSGMEPITLTAENPSVHRIDSGVPVPPIVGLPGGPVFCRITAGPFRRTYRLVLPDGGTVDLLDLLEEAIPWAAPVLNEGRELLAEMRRLRDRTLAEIAAANQVDGASRARRERILSALDAGDHRPMRVLSIGDDFAAASGQSSPEFGLTSQLAGQFFPGRVATWVPQTGDETQSWELFANELRGADGHTIKRVDDFPWGREFGGDMILRVEPGATRKRYLRLYWGNRPAQGGNQNAETISWRPAGETQWRDLDSWQHGGMVWGLGVFSCVVDMGAAAAVELSAAADDKGRPMLYLGASICDEPFTAGVEVFDMGWDGWDAPEWCSRFDAWPMLKSWVRMLNPDLIHLSSIYYDVDGGVAEQYEPSLVTMIESVRGICGSDVPVIGTIRPMPDLVHPDWSSGPAKARWDAYKQGFTTTITSMGGAVVDLDSIMGPMSGLSPAVTSGDRMARQDRGLRTGPMHLSNLGATRAARAAANLIRAYE